MEIRGIGDTQGFRRLLWLFGTTIVAPAALLGIMALGAAGHRQWTAAELEAREVAVQLPLVAQLLQARTEALNTEVRRLTQTCDSDDECRPPDGVASWFEDGTWQADLDRLSVWATEQLAAERVQLIVTHAPERGDAVPLAGQLAGRHLVPEPPLAKLEEAREPLRAAAATSLLGILLMGVVLGLRSAAREIRMSRRQTELVSRVSHELRTPMTSIRMFVDLLGSARLDPDRTKECLELLSQETERLSRRIEDVLLWARMESGARRYRQVEVPASELAQEALEAFQSQHIHEDSPPRIDIDLPEELPPLRVDRDAVVEAMLNLLVNAVRHTTEPRRIVIGARTDGRRVGLSVADNGPGIGRQDRRRIFEKFYRADDEPDESLTRGTGLGLAIVRSIVRAHGGRVELDSDTDRGSTFTLWFPAA